jgi:hypothetical protein
MVPTAHISAALTGGGCCFSCCTCCLTCNECGRQRRYMRKRFNMPGGDYYLDGWPGDCCEATCMTPLTVLQEAREVEIRTRRRWDYVRGFRGVGEDIGVAICGEETLENVLVQYVPKERYAESRPASFRSIRFPILRGYPIMMRCACTRIALKSTFECFEVLSSGHAFDSPPIGSRITIPSDWIENHNQHDDVAALRLFARCSSTLVPNLP